MSVPTIDLTGLTFNVAMAVIAADLDKSILIALKRCEVEFAKQGANAEEIATMLDFQRDKLEEWRDRCLADMREWLIEREQKLLH